MLQINAPPGAPVDRIVRFDMIDANLFGYFLIKWLFLSERMAQLWDLKERSNCVSLYKITWGI